MTYLICRIENLYLLLSLIMLMGVKWIVMEVKVGIGKSRSYLICVIILILSIQGYLSQAISLYAVG